MMSDRVYRPYRISARGEAARDAGGSYFQSHQGEHHQLGGRWAHGVAQLFVIELDDHTWLADRCAYHDEPTYPTRELALQSAAAGVIDRVKRMAIEWRQIHVEQANAISRWAANTAELPAPDVLIVAPSQRRGQLALFGGVE